MISAKIIVKYNRLLRIFDPALVLPDESCASTTKYHVPLFDQVLAAQPNLRVITPTENIKGERGLSRRGRHSGGSVINGMFGESGSAQ